MTVADADNCFLIKVDFPVALGPKRKNDFLDNKFGRLRIL
jgi:hypothetical protein